MADIQEIIRRLRELHSKAAETGSPVDRMALDHEMEGSLLLLLEYIAKVEKESESRNRLVQTMNKLVQEACAELAELASLRRESAELRAIIAAKTETTDILGICLTNRIKENEGFISTLREVAAVLALLEPVVMPSSTMALVASVQMKVRKVLGDA